MMLFPTSPLPPSPLRASRVLVLQKSRAISRSLQRILGNLHQPCPGAIEATFIFPSSRLASVSSHCLIIAKNERANAMREFSSLETFYSFTFSYTRWKSAFTFIPQRRGRGPRGNPKRSTRHTTPAFRWFPKLVRWWPRDLIPYPFKRCVLFS